MRNSAEMLSLESSPAHQADAVFSIKLSQDEVDSMLANPRRIRLVLEEDKNFGKLSIEKESLSISLVRKEACGRADCYQRQGRRCVMVSAAIQIAAPSLMPKYS